MPDGLGVVPGARLLWHALRARRARARADGRACRDSILEALDIALSTDGCGGGPAEPIRDCEPIVHTRGGFFS